MRRCMKGRRSGIGKTHVLGRYFYLTEKVFQRIINLVRHVRKGGADMDHIIVTDMAGATIEHSTVIVNMVSAVKSQLKDSVCRVYSDNVQYRWNVNDTEKIVIPDASINCRVHAKKGNSFFDIPRFVMEVVSPSTEKYDRNEKKEIYEKMEIDEYWIVDWRKKCVEIYTLDYENDGQAKYYLFNTVTEENKEQLRLVCFPNIEVQFDELFEL